LAGLSLVAAADLVIAVDGARFTSAYTQIGLTPDGSSSHFLTRLIGPQRALELYLTIRTLLAAEALDLGLVNRVVSPAELETEVTKLADQLARRPTCAPWRRQEARPDGHEQYARITNGVRDPHDRRDGGNGDAREGMPAFVSLSWRSGGRFSPAHEPRRTR
jgi:2-(1,2-epoxy-1,2-dihydrophenyl)acetyl-CoA isomerase